MGPDHAPRKAAVAPVDHRLTDDLDAKVGQRSAEASGVLGELTQALARGDGQRVLVEDLHGAALAEGFGRTRRPRLAPALRQPARGPGCDGFDRLGLAHVSSGTPSIGVDASA